MRNILDRLINPFLRAPEDGGGASNDAAAPPVAAAGGGDAAAAPAGDAGASAAPPPAGDVPPPADAAAAPKYDGVPDHMVGASEKDTIANLAKALKGYRDRDAQRGEVPDAPDGYLAEFADVPEVAKPYFETMPNDPVFLSVAEKAKELGLSKPQFQSLISTYIEANVQAGMFEQLVDPEKEKAALLPESARGLPKAEQDAAIDRRLNENIGWLKAMEQRGLSKEATDYATMMLMDTAYGNQFVEFIRAQVSGGGTPPLASGAPAGKDARLTQLRADMTKPEYDPRRPEFDKTKWEAAQNEIMRLTGVST